MRWTTCIINKFLRTVWDIWNFRNALVHGKGGVFQRATNSELDFQIREEFTIGFENFCDEDKKLYRDYTVPILTNTTITFKRQWLHSIRAARSASSDSKINPRVSYGSWCEYLTLIKR